jgi:hypothetical protein
MMFLKFLLEYYACSQIWLNLPVDDRHFDHITKWTKYIYIYIYIYIGTHPWSPVSNRARERAL